MKLIFATNNKNKLHEVKQQLAQTIELLSLSDINFNDDIAETETTIEGNALLKVKTIYQFINNNCFADDSGLFVDALNGEPGVYSARYAGIQKNDADNNAKLLQMLIGVKNRNAHFKTVLALIINDTNYFFEGIINGTITHQKIGENGFGYDSIFKPNGYTTTFAEMTLEEKIKTSHRAIAVSKLSAFLKTITH